MDEDQLQMWNNQGIAELIATPNDVDKEVLEMNFPFMNKVMAFSNLSEKDAMIIRELRFIWNIQKRSHMTRLQKQKMNRVNDTIGRAYMNTMLTLGKDGLAVKRLTSAYKNIQMDSNEQKSRGLMGMIRGGGGNG